MSLSDNDILSDIPSFKKTRLFKDCIEFVLGILKNCINGNVSGMRNMGEELRNIIREAAGLGDLFPKPQ